MMDFTGASIELRESYAPSGYAPARRVSIAGRPLTSDCFQANLAQNVLLQVPNDTHGFPPELLASLSTKVLDEPAAVFKAKPVRRK
jgi:hypothetical protein